MSFERLKEGDDIREVLKAAYGVELDVSGGWGYDKESALVITDTKTPKEQLEYMLATMRANLEMNITQPKENRYGGVRAEEIKRTQKDGIDKVTYLVSGMKESEYEEFIAEYKENFGKESFDIEEHFKRREEATLRLEVEFYFKKLTII